MDDVNRVFCCPHVRRSWYSNDKNAYQHCDVCIICLASVDFILRYGGIGHYAADARSSSGVLAGHRVVSVASNVFRGYGAQSF